MSDDLIQKLNEASNGADIGTFIQKYRQTLDDQFEADKANLENQRRLGHTSIMSANNIRGVKSPSHVIC